MGRVGRSIELRSKHLATRTGLHHRRAISFSIGQADPPVVPVASPLHEQRVNGVHGERAYRLQDICDSWGPRTGITVIIGHIRIEAADARTMLLLNEDVATIAVTADPGEDHWDTLEAEMPAGRYPRRIVVHPANHRGATQVDLAGDGFLKAKSNAPDFGCRNTLSLQVPSQSQRFVSADILYIEPLAIEVGGFDYVIVQERDAANALAHQGRGDVRNETPSADTQHAALGEDLLVKAGDLALAVFSAGNCLAAQPNRGL